MVEVILILFFSPASAADTRCSVAPRLSSLSSVLQAFMALQLRREILRLRNLRQLVLLQYVQYIFICYKYVQYICSIETQNYISIQNTESLNVRTRQYIRNNLGVSNSLKSKAVLQAQTRTYAQLEGYFLFAFKQHTLCLLSKRLLRLSLT